MRKAVIDLGTNTFNLLIAEVDQSKMEVLHAEKNGVALGMGGINEGFLSKEAMMRGLAALEGFKEQCVAWKVSEVRAIGTSALRGATNQLEFCERVYNQLGWKIEVVDGLQEAELIYKGVRSIYPFPEKSLIVDIGGGSTEFILADASGVIDMASFNIGVSRIYQMFQLNDPISSADQKGIIQFLEKLIDDRMDAWSVNTLIGSSGSFETFYALHKKELIEKKSNIFSFHLNDLQKVTESMIQSTLAEREMSPWIIPIRQKMMPITSVKVNWILNKFNIKTVYISPYSLKEGALLD